MKPAGRSLARRRIARACPATASLPSALVATLGRANGGLWLQGLPAKRVVDDPHIPKRRQAGRICAQTRRMSNLVSDLGAAPPTPASALLREVLPVILQAPRCLMLMTLNWSATGTIAGSAAST